MSHFIPLKQACDYLGVSDSAIVTSEKYKPFYKKSDTGTRNAMFDLKGFTDYQDLQVEFLEKVKLFTEYLFHIEEMTYTDIAKVGGTHLQAITQLSYGYDTSKRIFRRFKHFRPFHTKRFHEYYGFSAKGLKYAV